MNVDLEAAIRQKLDFTENDLTANREGRLSVDQIQKIIEKKQSCLQGAGLAIAFATVLFVANLFIKHPKYSEAITQALVICGGLALILIYLWSKWTQYVSDLERGVAFASEGKMEFIINYNRGGSVRSRAVRINNAQFPIGKDLFQLLIEVTKEHSGCAIYYTPKSNVILSFEVLDWR